MLLPGMLKQKVLKMLVSDKDYKVVSSNEMKTAEANSGIAALATFELGADIAITCFNPATKKIGIARTHDFNGIKEFLETIIIADVPDSPICEIQVIGGNENLDATRYMVDLVKILHEIDQGADIINLASAAIGSTHHPQSFRMTASDGKIGEIQMPEEKQ